MLEGSVCRGGSRLRITGQLIDARTGRHLWADRFDGNLSDVFDLQDRITESAVAAVEPTVQFAEVERQKLSKPRRLDAYDLPLRAYALEHAFTAESTAAALACLDRALAIEPTYAGLRYGGLLPRAAPFPGLGRAGRCARNRGRQAGVARGRACAQ